MKKIDYKWTALALLWVACFLQQGMRQIFPPLAGAIGADFALNAKSLGTVMLTFTFVYALAVPFSGMAGDFLSRKKIVIFSLAVFSAGVMAAGWADGLVSIAALYGALNGFGQSFFYPAATSLVQQLHSDRKATALSILQLALYSGIILMSFASGKLLDVCGSWRVPFKAFGAAGLVWAAALVFLLRDTKPVAAAAGVGASVKPSAKEAILAVVKKPSALLLAGGLSMQIFVDVGFKMWGPKFLEDAFPGMAHATYALNAVLWHYLGAFAGVMLGSRIADRFVRSRHGIRMEMNILGLVLGAPFIVWMGFAGSFTAACVAMGLFGFFRGVYDSNQFASIFDVIAPRYRASAMGVMLSIAFLIGATASFVLGWARDAFGDMRVAFAALSGFFIVGAGLIALARVKFLERDYEN